MSSIVILDVSCIIWDANDYSHNTNQYYTLRSKLSNLITVLRRERPYVLLRDDLITEMINCFPFDVIPDHFYDYTNQVFDFISNIPSDRQISCHPDNRGITSNPVILKQHFNANTIEEVSYVLTYIHAGDERNCYFTTPHLYGSDSRLRTTENGITQDCNTVFFDDENVLANYFDQFKKIFEPNPVHHIQNKPRSAKSKLRCYNGHDTIVPQTYLDGAIFDNNRYYFYDPDNFVYVIFMSHQENRFHGHEEKDLNKIPQRVRRHFNI
jgi:hypothetical protein